jgi:hypothetical protein
VKRLPFMHRLRCHSEQREVYSHSARLQATLYARSPTWNTFFVMTVFGQLPWKDPMRMAPPKPWLWLSTNVLLVKKERSVPARASLSQKSWKIAPPNAPFTVTLLPEKVDCTMTNSSEMRAVRRVRSAGITAAGMLHEQPIITGTLLHARQHLVLEYRLFRLRTLVTLPIAPDVIIMAPARWPLPPWKVVPVTDSLQRQCGERGQHRQL